METIEYIKILFLILNFKAFLNICKSKAAKELLSLISNRVLAGLYLFTAPFHSIFSVNF